MKTKELLKEISGVFVPPVKRYYFGKIVCGVPYFNPIGFVSSIVKIRRLKLRDEEEYQKKKKESPWLNKSIRFTNMPMVHRSKEWTFKLFCWWFVEIGYPFYIGSNELGWKTKYDSVRFEWSPAFYVFFFHWQFCIFWNAPDGDSDKYYEMILWWMYYSNKDVDKARSSWGWVDYETKVSTWNEKYLIKQNTKL